MQNDETHYFFQNAQKSERALIGAILLDNELMDLALEHFRTRQFCHFDEPDGLCCYGGTTQELSEAVT